MAELNVVGSGDFVPEGARGLLEADFAADPLDQFRLWWDEGRARIKTPEAIALATASADGAPSLRMVLLKGFDERGYVFYTNAGSRKGQELTANPRAALLLHWEPMHRQVRIEGTVSRVTAAETERYFRTRPRESQAAAAISQQSAVVASRDSLDRAYEQLLASAAGGEVPIPAEWTGFRVRPSLYEFWQARLNRMHDRLSYRPDGERWIIERLSP